MAILSNGVNGDSASKHQDIIRTLNGIGADAFENDGQRIEVVTAAYALVARLETPWDFVLRLVMGQPALGAALKVAMDLQLYQKWHDAGDGEMTLQQIQEMVPNIELKLLSRILRHLAANHVLEEPSIGVFKPTSLSVSFNKPVFGEWINHLYDATLPCFSKMPRHLAQTKYRNPVDPADGIFQYAKDCRGMDMFHFYQENKVEGESFNQVMGGVMATQAGWLEIFPHDKLLTSVKKDGPLLVDVGGSIGHDMERFRKAHPETASRLYLEDLPEVVKLSKCPDPVNKIGHDFFTPQPIKADPVSWDGITGARAYYMHGVLHDWSDEPARKILEMQRDALTPGYSSLLIHDHVAPESIAHPHTTAYDLTMMVMVAGEERTESHWRELLKSAGYRVVKIWSSPLAVQRIIEAELDV
ncbi:s-adenosyl-l-methionine-dependent methyltransferase [Colletotrichum incanum]|uniref:S-adenosyl-l-methionine-dependent methyltransferase n=1 Tax=Colletotrichum incanum TaxID=1573173 RepID=A0A167AQR2_COLIC|nr:s-adenosyl-l-methionine-dependent methyltransferase [Colletotrichum incanum]OHW94722.1 s-adenosyl-l-methionine-dependent methyltransferase [Colletotrichum incanum]